MRYGMFMQPSHPPHREVADGIEQDLRIIEWCDQLGFSEVWVGEHLTAPWEPYPACDLILAQAIPRTEQITLCAGAYVVPFYHPAALALRIAQLDHMARGRFICGIAAGSIATDFALLGVDAMRGQQRDMMRDASRSCCGSGMIRTTNGSTRARTGPSPTRRRSCHFTRTCSPSSVPHPPIGIAGLVSSQRQHPVRRRTRFHSTEPHVQRGLPTRSLERDGRGSGIGRTLVRPGGLASSFATSSSRRPTPKPGSGYGRVTGPVCGSSRTCRC